MIQKEPRIGVGAAIIKDDKILLIRRKNAPEADHWALPGGKVDLFETCETAVTRETKEEIDVEIQNPFLLTLMDMWDEEKTHHWIAPIYLVTEFIGEPSIQEPHKHSGLGWFSIHDLPNPSAKAVKDAVFALKIK
ncbi:MAG: NUDIX domain-containing protein [Caulobacterales bacterium]|nr:NUDIX domain-containing protein [Caulobacterales bacterium]MCA0371575.1 NUDIX domain-containing protein [Pseudomonadota bacterium]